LAGKAEISAARRALAALVVLAIGPAQVRVRAIEQAQVRVQAIEPAAATSAAVLIA
jgi:hypothetical protein